MPTSDPPCFKHLKDKQRALKDRFPDNMGLRVHRAISWIGRAERETDDPAARFIFLWIAFNAAYADQEMFEVASYKDKKESERKKFAAFFEKLVKHDWDARIYKAIWDRFPGPVHDLMENRFVFEPFWLFRNGIPGFEHWKSFLAADRRLFKMDFDVGHTRTVPVLCRLFGRLYVLRNQLVHGGATWNSKVNRTQVRDGAAIAGFLIPIFVDLMLDHPTEDWGRPFYPVVPDDP